MEQKMYKKQLKFGIKENIEMLKVTSVRFVYLIELSTVDNQLNCEPWLMGTEECQFQSSYPIITKESKLKKNYLLPKKAPAKRAQSVYNG